MELREFAEQVLFGTTLDDKLVSPSAFEDQHPGKPIATPRLPGRPGALALGGPRRAKVRFPSLHELTHPRAVGHVLHFFANHELLAMELMALVLLKFPEAPASFRRGVAFTLLEEQSHMRLYRERMAACGVELGEIPVNAYFWNAISPMASPMDFVTQMSLTFEQANLDFSLHYTQAFEQIGDAETASLMQRVYEDEIGHVEHGLTWFNQWREPASEPEFDAFARLLPAPLTPRRARGAVFSVEARQRAGFSSDFIERIQLFNASRGRAPNVYLFNPSCESEIVFGAGYTPRAHLRALERDLETLPLFLANADDVVLVKALPSSDFLRSLHNAGVVLPQFARIDTLEHPKLSELRPWGWSPAALKRLAPLAPRAHHPPPSWSPQRAELASKAAATQALASTLVDASVCGRVARDMGEVEDHLKSLRQAGDAVVVLKAPWGASGRDQIRVLDGQLEAGQRGWVGNILKQQQALVVEPWLDRVCDLSILFRTLEGRCKIDGITRFEVDGRGQYTGHHIGRWNRGLPSEVLRFVHEHDAQSALERAARAASAWLSEQNYRGPAGVDAFIYRDRAGGLQLKAFSELNPRYTMGHVALSLAKLLSPGKSGTWRLLRARDAPTTVAPLERDGRGLVGGELFTNPRSRASEVVGLLSITRS